MEQLCLESQWDGSRPCSQPRMVQGGVLFFLQLLCWTNLKFIGFLGTAEMVRHSFSHVQYIRRNHSGNLACTIILMLEEYVEMSDLFILLSCAK